MIEMMLRRFPRTNMTANTIDITLTYDTIKLKLPFSVSLLYDILELSLNEFIP
jgi:hypothetical protein